MEEWRICSVRVEGLEAHLFERRIFLKSGVERRVLRAHCLCDKLTTRNVSWSKEIWRMIWSVIVGGSFYVAPLFFRTDRHRMCCRNKRARFEITDRIRPAFTLLTTSAGQLAPFRLKCAFFSRFYDASVPGVIKRSLACSQKMKWWWLTVNFF